MNFDLDHTSMEKDIIIHQSQLEMLKCLSPLPHSKDEAGVDVLSLVSQIIIVFTRNSVCTE